MSFAWGALPMPNHCTCNKVFYPWCIGRDLGLALEQSVEEANRAEWLPNKSRRQAFPFLD
jgi:hypothetical protein